MKALRNTLPSSQFRIRNSCWRIQGGGEDVRLGRWAWEGWWSC